MPFTAFNALTERAAQNFGVSPLILWSIATVESGRNPKAVNKSPRAMVRGGAWGLFQMTLATARDLFTRFGTLLRQFPAAAKWNDTGESLLDPELNTLLGAFYLGRLSLEFHGAFVPTVAAYQQGPGPVRAVLAKGGNPATDLPAKGREYIALALAASNARKADA